jgi:Ca-activated chloride channel homolog
MPVRNTKPFYLALLLAIGVSLLLTGLPAFSQQAGNDSAQNTPEATTTPQPAVSNGQNQPFTFKTSVTEVVLYATVVDSHERLVTNLQKEDFTVYENNVPQTISSFGQEDVPVSLAILIDNSGSMAQKRSAVNRAAIDLIQASNPQDEAFIVNFSDEAFLDQDFTSDVDLLRKGLSHIDSQGGTALYDAVIAAADHLAKQAKHPKQVILIITDGEDNSSSATLAETVRRIQDLNGPIVYSIGLLYDEPDHTQGHRARKALQSLSDQTGGIAFFPKSPKWPRISAINMFLAITQPSPSARAVIAPSDSRPKLKESASFPSAPEPAISPLPTPSPVTLLRQLLLILDPLTTLVWK